MPDDTAPMSDLAPSACEGWLRRHRRGVLVVLAVAAVTVRLVLCVQIAGGPLARVHELVPGSDNHFFDAWGRRIADGDLLQRAPAHPMTDWMQAVAATVLEADPRLPVTLGLAPDLQYDPVAMRERLWDHWLGGATFYQEPAYPYAVGLTYWLTGAEPWHVFAWQLALGVALVLLVHAIARRIFSETAAAAAGALAVLAPIPLMLEVTLLRDALVAFVTVALTFLMRWATEGRRRRWLVLGFAFGAAMLVKTTFLLFPLAMGAWRLASRRESAAARLAAAGLVVSGMAVALLPAILRNVAVGAPALAMAGGSSALAAYHASGARPFDLVIGKSYATVLARTGGHPISSILAAARTYESPWGMPLLELKKLLYAWHGYEAPNNVDFYLFRQGAPILKLLPVTFVVVLPLASLGLATRRAGRCWPILIAVLASLPTLVLGAVHSRYRAPLAAALLPLAGAGVVRALAWAHARRFRSLAAAAVAAAAYVVWATIPPPGKSPHDLARKYAQRGQSWRSTGELGFAALHLQESLRLEPGDASVEAQLGEVLLASNEPGRALPHLDAAARLTSSPEVQLLRARALVALGRLDEARKALGYGTGGLQPEIRR